METNIIEYYTKSVYGNELCYVANEKIARAISLITGRKALMSYDFEGLKLLGFTFKEVLKPKN